MSYHSDLPPSSSDKWLKCHAWRKTVAPLRGRDSGLTPSAEEGTLAHSVLEALLTGYPLPGNIPPEMFDYVSSVSEWMQSQSGELHVEVPVDFGDAFGFVGLTGTPDQILVEPDCLTIGDLKYGMQPVEVQGNSQLLCYLVGAVGKFGPRERYRIVIQQPRAYHPDGPIREAFVTPAELEVFSKELHRAIRGSFGNSPKHTVGQHCRHYCPALATCPAVREFSLNLLRDTPII